MNVFFEELMEIRHRMIKIRSHAAESSAISDDQLQKIEKVESAIDEAIGSFVL